MLPDEETSTSPIRQISSGRDVHSAHTHHDLPHVLLVLDGFPKVLGGGERIVLRLAELLPNYGYRASVLTFRVHPDGEFNPETAPCPVFLLPLTSTYDMAAIRGAFALRRFLKQQKVCLVETFFESSDIWAGFVTRFMSSAKLVWSRRDMGILRGAKHRIAYRAMRRCPHAVIAVSRRVADHVIAVDGVASSKVHVIHNGLSMDPHLAPLRSMNPRSGDTIAITTIGNVRKVKGHDLLVLAAQQISKQYPQVCFTVAGEVLEPSYHSDLVQQIAASGMQERFIWLGKVSDTGAQLAAAHLFVLPSRSEGFSNALIEAMAAGLPVIATDVGGNSEAIQDGVNGLLIPPDDVQALTNAIASLLADPERATRLGSAARATVEQRFTADAMMHAVTDVFASVL